MMLTLVLLASFWLLKGESGIFNWRAALILAEVPLQPFGNELKIFKTIQGQVRSRLALCSL